MRCKRLLTWLRFGRKKIYPWKFLAMTACDYFNFSRVKQEQAKVSFLATLWKIDTPKMIELMNDLL